MIASVFPKKPEALVFDLDDTLYDHVEYVSGAYREAAEAFHRLTGRSASGFRTRAWDLFMRRGSRDNMIFSDVLKEHGCYSKDGERVLVQAYRDHCPTLTVLPGVKKGLWKLKLAGLSLGLLSDGQPETQRRKLRSLGLIDVFDQIVISSELGSGVHKPAPRCFNEILSRLAAEPANTVFIGDDPKTDVAGAVAAGIPVIRVRRGQYVNEPSPEADMVFDDTAEAIVFLVANRGGIN